MTNDQPNQQLRLGFLYPGYAAEDDYPYLAELLAPPARAEIVHTSVGEDAHRVDALLDLGSVSRLAAGAAELRERGVASVVWACTSGSFVFGWDGARDQVGALAEQLGVPASSTSIAFVDACRSRGVARVAVAASYPADVTTRLVDFLRRGGIEVASVSSRGIVTAVEVGALSAESVRDLVLEQESADAEAVLVPDTAMHTARALSTLAAEAGKPVLTANQVSVWQAARLAGHPDADRLLV